MKKKDIVFILILCFAGLLSFFLLRTFTASGDMVKITVNGKLFSKTPLSDDCEINIGGTNTLVIENGFAYMKDATCKDKLCVHMGKISDNSKKIICLPNKVIVEITKKSQIDTVVK